MSCQTCFQLSLSNIKILLHTNVQAKMTNIVTKFGVIEGHYLIFLQVKILSPEKTLLHTGHIFFIFIDMLPANLHKYI